MRILRLGLSTLLVLSFGCGASDLAAPEPTGSGAPIVQTRVVIPGAATVGPVTLNLNSGWNSVALQCSRVTSLTPGPGVSGMAWFDGSTYQTTGVSVTDFNAGEGTRRGFWVYASAPAGLTYSGDDSPGAIVSLRTGWNLVAFPAPSAIPGSTLICRQGGQVVALGSVVLPQFYEIGSGSAYTIVDVSSGGSCQPGKAYWVYARDAVTLGYGAPVASPTPTPSSSPLPSPSPSGGGGVFKLISVTPDLPATLSFDNHEGGYNITINRPGDARWRVYHKIGGGGVTIMGYASWSATWTEPPAQIRPREVWPVTATVRLDTVSNPLIWSGWFLPSVLGGDYLFPAPRQYLEVPASNSAGTTVTQAATLLAPAAGAPEFDVQEVINSPASCKWFYHYKWVP